LKRIGAFRLPNPSAAASDPCAGFSYGGIGFTFSPTGDNGKGSLLATGNTNCSLIGEVTIPEIVDSSDLNQLKVAPFVSNQPRGALVDALEGGLRNSGITGGGTTLINGILEYKDKLYITAGNNYSGYQPVSHWVRPRDLNITGQVSLPATVRGDGSDSESTNPKYTAGYMCKVPDNLINSLGGPIIGGWIPESSFEAIGVQGPSAFAYDPSAITGGQTTPAKTLLFYKKSNPLQEAVSGQVQEVWNWTSTPRGCAIPDGTRSVLFIGRHGQGTFNYGVGGANGYVTSDPSIKIYDPSDTSTGEHAWPYRYQVWAYDSNVLKSVKDGTSSATSAQPYAIWTIELPFVNPGDGHYTGGMAYDSRSRRLFLVQHNAGPFGEPVVHVFEVTNAVASQ
jgi:hypothetical protein